MSPAELAQLAAFLSERLALSPSEARRVAGELAVKYVIFERTEPTHPGYCDECGFSGGAGGHHPKCSAYDKTRRAAGDANGFGRTA